MGAISVEATAKHVAALLGLATNGKKGQATDLKGDPVVGCVEDEAGMLVCLLVFDALGAASVGAALSRIPAGAAQGVGKSGVLDEALFANFHEVLNVLTVLTTAAVGRRTILRTVRQGKEAVTPAVKAFMGNAPNKVFGQLSIAGYPLANFAFYH